MEIFGLELTKTKKGDFLNEISSFLLAPNSEQKIISTPNPEILLYAKDDEAFKNILKKADYLLPDGIGLYIAYQILENKDNNKLLNILKLPYYFFNLFFRRKMLYEKYGERICGSDLTNDLLIFAERNDIRITVIDLYSPGDMAKEQAQLFFDTSIKKYFPNIKLDFFVYNPAEKETIVQQISESDSKILFSTLGMYTQEKSIIDIMQISENIKLGLGIGSSFDYMTGFQKRAPKAISSMGFEWLYRIFTSPNKTKRIKRIQRAVFVFIYEVYKK